MRVSACERISHLVKNASGDFIHNADGNLMQEVEGSFVESAEDNRCCGAGHTRTQRLNYMLLQEVL